MKLIFIGNSGSGKTTLAERVALELNEAIHYSNLKDLTLPNPRERDFETIIDLQERVRDRILNTIIETSSGCYDRSLFDQYCYSNKLVGQSLTFYNEKSLQGSSYFKMPKRALTHFKWTRFLLRREIFNVTKYFYCDSLDEYIRENDIQEENPVEKVRWGRGDLQLSEIYVKMYEILLPPYKVIKVPAMGLEERVDFVMERI